jgi:hypothetical protein
MLVGLRNTPLIFGNLIVYKRLKSPFSIKGKLNKEKPLFNSFPFWKILSNSIKR